MARSGQRVLILAATTAYQTDDLIAAAERLGIEPVLATDRCHVLAEVWPQGAIAIDVGDPEGAARTLARRAAGVAGIVPTDERTAVIASLAARELGLAHNPPGAARAAADKLAFRNAARSAGLPHPAFRALAADDDPAPAARELGYPVVIKPLHLSASRGVMRADTPEELAERAERLRRLLSDPEVRARGGEASFAILVERYVPGGEVAFEGALSGGELEELAIFDKPDPLEGPFFPETIYVTPPARPEAEIRAIREAVAGAARATGLREGPVHAEVRLGPEGPVVLELAARSIGGLCGRSLRYGAGVSVEEAAVAHAAGRDARALRDERAPAAGVMMLPVTEAGVLRAIDGEAAAAAVPGIAEVAITARPGDVLVPLPEGRAYLGFLFATGADPSAVADALRRARAALRARVARTL